MRLRSAWLFAVALASGCASLDGLTGAPEDAGAPDGGGACGAPGAPDCGPHGRCAPGAPPTCACDDGWAGATCAACAPGLADPDGTGVCRPGVTCGSTTCPAHSICDQDGGAPSCRCATGYTLTDGACAWTGVVRDPQMRDDPPGAWELDGGAALAADAAASRDPGEVVLSSKCLTAVVAQSFDTPPADVAEPLALDVTASGRCRVGGPLPLDLPCVRPISAAVGARGFEPVPVVFAGGYASQRACLGERAYGTRLPLTFFPRSCSFVTSLTIDHAEIVPDPTCPAVGKVLNGDLEGTGGWTVGGTGAEVAAGVGNGGSRGGRLHAAKRCDAPSLTTRFSVPMSSPKNAALVFTVKGTQNRKMSILALQQTVGTITGTSVYEKVSLCMPERLRGMAADLLFTVTDDTPGGACGDADDREFVFDDLSLVDDPSCAGAFVVAGDFERKDAARYWSTSLGTNGSVFVANGAGAHGGSGYALVSQPTCSSSSSMTQIVTIPDAAVAKAPALSFYYQATSATNVTYGSPAGALTPAATWTKASVCLPARRAGFAYSATFSVSASDACNPGTLRVDDVAIVDDPSCAP